ncbi:MAG: caspase family protein [Crocinitomicaceae bacterium]|nr:caspase family protein [Crocinitomicaceae bacterium]MCF8433837.1 caspase family protein [Crocinitomicaceae bacterium]
MSKLWTIIFLCISLSALAQRGANPEVISSSKSTTGTTYALVMGVSKYENPNIPELKYADIDALVFREYLLSTGIKEENVYTLINENAKNASFWSTLNYLSDQVKEGDVVYIYFSGHGDVESKTIVQDAYLLPYDSPYTVYPMGAIGIIYLKSWISTFSSKGVQTIFIADACKSGNLIGGREGMEATANILKDKWQDEIKIVSCQPGELSLEGEQWGGGRGLFSYELINGLSGLADKNKDDEVTLRELNLYLLEKVPEQSGRNPQNPMLIGNYEATIAFSNKQFIDQNSDSKDLKITSDKNNADALAVKGILNSNALRSANDIVYQSSDNQSMKLYNEFNGLLKEGKLISYYPPSAYSIYQDLEKLNGDPKLVESAKLLLSERIMQDIQKFVRFIIGDIGENEHGPLQIINISLEATILREMIGDKKLIESGNFARVLFSEACRSLHKFVKDDDLLMPKELAIMKLDTALSMDKGAVYVNCLKGMIFEFEFYNEEIALNEYKIAVANNPNFRIARNMLLMRFAENKDYASILDYTKDQRNNLLNILYSCIAFKNLNMNDSAKVYLAKIQSRTHIPADPRKEFETCSETGDFLINERDLENAKYYFEKALKSLERCCGVNEEDLSYYFENVALLNYNLACLYSLLLDVDKSLFHLEKCLAAGWTDIAWLMKDEDLNFIRKSKKFTLFFDKNPNASYNLACFYALSGQQKEALKQLEKAFSAGWSDFDWLEKDSDLATIKETKKFKALLKKYRKK